MHRVLAIFLCLALATVTSACGSGAGGPSVAPAGTTAPTQSVSATPAAPPSSQVESSPATPPGSCGGNDVGDALTAAAAAQNAADSYRVSGTITTDSVLEAELEIQKPDRIHARAGDLEFISVGAETWRKVGDTWQEAPGVDVRSLIGGMGQLDAELIADASFTNVAVEASTVEGANAILYEYHESIPDQLEADVQLWLDPQTCRPIRNVATGTASSVAPTYDVTYSDWNSVTVEAPQ